MRNVFLCLVAIHLLATGRLHAQSNLVLINSAPGDYVGQGLNYETTNVTDITVGETTKDLHLAATNLSIQFVAGGDSNLLVGFYTNLVLAAQAVAAGSNGVKAGLTVTVSGRSCDPGCGTFQIFEMHTDTNGIVDHFWATFAQKCQCAPAPITGEIRYQSQLAPPIPLPRTLKVPEDFTTIGAALSNASPVALDTILVAPGVYPESLSFMGKPAQLLSQGGPAVTVITPPSNSAGVVFNSGETSNSVLSGFTISSTSQGIYVAGSTPLIRSNIITNCVTGIACGNSSPTLLNNQVVGSPGLAGGSQVGTGIYCYFSSPSIISNTVLLCGHDGIFIGGASTPWVQGNTCASNGYYGIEMYAAGWPVIRNNVIQQNGRDGMFLSGQSDALIIQNLVISNNANGIAWLAPGGASGPYAANNTIAYNGGIGLWARGNSANGVIINNILVGTPALRAEGYNSTVLPIIQFNDAFSPDGVAVAGQLTSIAGISNNISVDPLFSCLETHAFHLLAGSPAIDAGTNGALYLPGTDLAGNSRFLPGKTNSGTVVDLGAFEFDPAAVQDPCVYLFCPPNMTAVATPGQTSALVNFPVPFAPPVATVVCDPPTGSLFPGGPTTVNCLASYGGNTDVCSFTITVFVPPVITNQPASTSVSAGQPFNLSVGTAGTGPFGYSWTFEGSAIGGATGSTLTIANAQAINEGVYRTIVTNLYGTATSAVALVRVLAASPTITSNPVPLNLPAGTNAVFAVTATGSQPLAYQWWFNGTAIGGATATQYVIPDVQAGNAGNYQAVVSNGVGTVAGSVAALAVIPAAPRFITQPVGAAVFAGATNFTLTGLATGSEPISYQWFLNGVPFPDANQNFLTLTNLAPTNSGAYSLVASNVVGVSTSAVANVSVNLAVPVFSQRPFSVSLVAGTTNILNSLALGSFPLSYQWYFQGQVIPDQTNRQLSLAPVTIAAAGPYYVTASNPLGTVTSLVAQVTVVLPPSLSQPLTNQVITSGNTLKLAVVAAGSPFLSYSWRLNGTIISGTSSNLSVNAVQPAQSGYYSVTVANPYGSISSTGRVAVLGPPGWVMAWGDDSGGQTQVPTNLDDAVAVSGGDYHSLALRYDGSLVAWGYNGDGQTNCPTNALPFVAIASGAAHNLAITKSGSVIAWGRNEAGQLNVPVFSAPVLAVAAGDSYSMALLSPGTVVCWGDNTFGQVNGATNLTGIKAVAAGRDHGLALRSNGTVVGWGFNAYGQASVPAGLAGVQAIAAGYLHSAALLPNHTVVAWGDNSQGQTNVPAGLSNVVAIAAGDFHTLALRADGTVLGWGDNSLGQTAVVPALTNAAAIGAGNFHGLALAPIVPLLHWQFATNGLVIFWSGPGVLQSSQTPAGPFVDLPNTYRSYTNPTAYTPAQFFRLRR